MKLNIFTTATVLAIMGASLTQSAKAQFTANGAAASGDLILSFDDPTTTDTGTKTDFELDLGQLSLYSGATKTINIANINAALSSIYGSGYFTNSDINIGILGDTAKGTPSNGVLGGSVFASNPSTTPYPTIGTATLGVDNTAVTTFLNPAADAVNPPTNGPVAGSYDVVAASQASFDKTQGKDGFGNSTVTFDGGAASPDMFLNIEQPGTGFGKDTSSELANGGFFDITSNGEVQFVLPTTGQVPEPSTYALLALGGGLLFWHLRRKSVSDL